MVRQKAIRLLKNCSAFYLPISTLNLRTSTAPGVWFRSFYFYINNDGVWSDCIFVIVDYYGIRLLDIAFAIKTCYCSYRSDFQMSN